MRCDFLLVLYSELDLVEMEPLSSKSHKSAES